MKRFLINMKQVPMTVVGAQKLREELDFLKFERRPKITDAIAQAGELGDLKENAEYHAAREEQGLCICPAKPLVQETFGESDQDKAEQLQPLLKPPRHNKPLHARGKAPVKKAEHRVLVARC